MDSSRFGTMSSLTSTSTQFLQQALFSVGILATCSAIVSFRAKKTLPFKVRTNLLVHPVLSFVESYVSDDDESMTFIASLCLSLSHVCVQVSYLVAWPTLGSSVILYAQQHANLLAMQQRDQWQNSASSSSSPSSSSSAPTQQHTAAASMDAMRRAAQQR